MDEGANSLKGEFLGAVESLKSGLAEFNHPRNPDWKPLQLNMHIHQKPLLLRFLLGTLEGGIDIFLTAVTTK
jgi:hypothetical protein